MKFGISEEDFLDCFTSIEQVVSSYSQLHWREKTNQHQLVLWTAENAFYMELKYILIEILSIIGTQILLALL